MAKPEKTLVSVVNWNNAAATNKCLSGIAQLAEDEQPDVVVVDNHSTRGEFKIDPSVRKLLRSLEIVKNSENLGFAGGHNPNIRKAKNEGYDFIVLLNPDTEIIDSELFTKLADALESNPKTLGANPTILRTVDPNIIWYGGGELSLKTGYISHLRVGDVEKAMDGAKKASFLTGCCLAIALGRADLNQLLLPEAYFVYWEDTEWSARAAKAGFDLLYVPQARLLHHVSDSLGIRSPTYIYYNIRNHLLFIRRNVKFVYLPLCLGRLAIIILKYKFNIMFKYRGGRLPALLAIWRGWWDGIKNVTGQARRTL